MELDGLIVLKHKCKKNHKKYSRKINRAIFYKEVANFAFLERRIKEKTKKGNPLDSYDNSLAFPNSKNIMYTYLFINNKVFLDFYEEYIQINKVYFNKFNYVHWLYKNIKKMYENFIKYKGDDFYNPTLGVIERIDKQFYFFKLKNNTEVFERFVKKRKEKDMLIKLVKGSNYKNSIKITDEEYVESQIESLKQAFIKNNDQISTIKYEYSYGSTKIVEYINDVNLKVDREVLKELLSHIRKDVYKGGMVRIKMYMIREAIYGIGYKHETGDFLGFFIFNRIEIDNRMNRVFSNLEIISNLKNSKSYNVYTILDWNDIEVIEE